MLGLHSARVAPKRSALRSLPKPAFAGDWVICLLAALTLVFAVAVPLAPVIAADPVVSWPQVGQMPRSTVLPLSPYRPLELSAKVPCATLQTLAGRDGVALRTLPPAGSSKEGLTVGTSGGRVKIATSARTISDEPLPAGSCVYDIRADRAGIRVQRDNAVIAQQRGAEVPQVAELSTDADGSPAAAGLAVQMHPDDRYHSSPSAVKAVCLVGLIAALAATLALAWRRWPGSRSSFERPRVGWVDATLLAVLLAWVFLGPMHFDDGWYELNARNALASGYVGNYLWMFNVSENPFVLSQQVLSAWGELGGWSLLWLRMLPLLCGVGAWALLRMLLTVVLGRTPRPQWATWALLVAFLAWWLPYEMTLRPEPLVVLFAAAVLVFEELARRRRSVGLLAPAVACAGLALTCSPAGAAAAAPLVLSVRWVWEWLRAQAPTTRVAVVLVGLAAASTFVVVAFGDASLGDVLEANAVHHWYYATAFPWYQEIVQYHTLLMDPAIAWGRRGPVVLSVAALAVVAIASGRRPTPGDPLGRLLLTSAVATAAGLGSLALVPTKSVLHFPAAAAPAILLMAAALMRSPIGWRAAGAVAKVTSALIFAAAGAMTFAGTNWWPPYSDRGQPFMGRFNNSDLTPFQISQMAPHLGPVYLRNPLIWLAVAVAAIWLWRRRARTGARIVIAPDRALFGASAVALVVGLIAVFVYAPVHEYPGWTVALSNAKALTGSSCGLQDDVSVLSTADRGLGPPTGQPQMTGDVFASATQPPPTAPPAPVPAWYGATHQGIRSGGTLTTGWYPVPAEGDATHVTVPVAGNALASQQVEVQFADGNPADPTPRAAQPLVLDTRVDARSWQEAAIPLPRTGGQPTALRVVAKDLASGPDSWLAIAEPHLTRPRPVSSVTAGQPVLVDELSAGLWPCVREAAISNAIAQAPTVEIHADAHMPASFQTTAFVTQTGGAFAQVDRTATRTLMVSMMPPGSTPTARWGYVERDSYDHPVGLVDTTVEHRERDGWARLQTLSGTPYINHEYRG